MNALGSPAAAGTDDRRFVFDRTDWLRLVGGVLFAAGALVLLIRKSNDWSDWATFVGLLIPAVILLALAFLRRVPGEHQGWKAAFVVFGTLLLLSALIQLVNAAGGSFNGWNVVWTFGLAGAVAVFTSFALETPFQMLLGAIFGIVAWLALWDKISNPSPSTFQWLLIVLAVIYFAAALVLARTGRRQYLDLITAASLAAVLAAAFTFAGLAPRFGGVSAASSIPSGIPKPSQGWNIFLLVVSLLSIGFGSRGPTRGPSYIGAFGLTAFIGLVGVDAVHRISGGDAGGVVGWPLILLIIGIALAAAGFLLRPDADTGPGGPGTAGPGGPGQPAYAAPPAAAGPGAQPTPPATSTQPQAAPPQGPAGDQPTQQQPAPGQQETQVHRQPPPPGAPPPQA